MRGQAASARVPLATRNFSPGQRVLRLDPRVQHLRNRETCWTWGTATRAARLPPPTRARRRRSLRGPSPTVYIRSLHSRLIHLSRSVKDRRLRATATLSVSNYLFTGTVTVSSPANHTTKPSHHHRPAPRKHLDSSQNYNARKKCRCRTQIYIYICHPASPARPRCSVGCASFCVVYILRLRDIYQYAALSSVRASCGIRAALHASRVRAAGAGDQRSRESLHASCGKNEAER
ncbi:hypothetical protein C8R44DRAFT_239890 [Mycena epipterygia]|nr:hypothetical protein C8R44DRAFT_239890 [Mycena epipterygia]